MARAASSRRMVSSIASPNVSTTTPDTTNVDTSNAAAAEAIARPNMIPVRSMTDGVARRSGRFISLSSASADANALRQPTAPQEQR